LHDTLHSEGKCEGEKDVRKKKAGLMQVHVPAWPGLGIELQGPMKGCWPGDLTPEGVITLQPQRVPLSSR
jgi:hypothetical protein